MRSVKAEDSGYYTCTATNTLGFDTIIVNLLVQGKGLYTVYIYIKVVVYKTVCICGCFSPSRSATFNSLHHLNLLYYSGLDPWRQWRKLHQRYNSYFCLFYEFLVSLIKLLFLFLLELVFLDVNSHTTSPFPLLVLSSQCVLFGPLGFLCPTVTVHRVYLHVYTLLSPLSIV